MVRSKRCDESLILHSVFKPVHRSGCLRHYVQPYRPPIPFRSANNRRDPNYEPASQCHHLLPLQLLKMDCFENMFSKLDSNSIGFHDFRTNGLLLPSTEKRSVETGLPLHRGPHNKYNEVVMMRVGAVKRDWSQGRLVDPLKANQIAESRLCWLKAGLRSGLIKQCERSRMTLNRFDPNAIIGEGYDFTEMDDMAEIVMGATAGVLEKP